MILLLIRRTDEFMFGLLFAVLVQLFEILCYYSVVVDVRVALICLRYLFVCVVRVGWILALTVGR